MRAWTVYRKRGRDLTFIAVVMASSPAGAIRRARERPRVDGRWTLATHRHQDLYDDERRHA